MKSQKNIALRVILSIWAGLLCLSVFLKAEQVTLDIPKYSQRTSSEQLTAEELAFPVAWSEPTAPLRATTPLDSALPLLLPMFGKYIHLLEHLHPKPIKAELSFSSITEQFRILPNAP